MKLVPLSEVFAVEYGSKLDFNKMTPCARSHGVAFVGRASRNHGVVGFVRRTPSAEPYAAGLITVALGGSKLLSSFVQEDPFYTAQNVAVLLPRAAMDFKTKLYYCLCIRANRFRYSAFGREANRTLRTLAVPSLDDVPVLPESIPNFDMATLAAAINPDDSVTVDTSKWRSVTLGELFDVRKGKRLTRMDMRPGNTPFIGAIDHNNGLAARIDQPPDHPGNTITVNYNGAGVAEGFYQPVPFCASDDVNILYPKDFRLTPLRALFLVPIIRLEKYRFSYGRKWHAERMRESSILLPMRESIVDWDWIDRFMQSLRFSGGIKTLFDDGDAVMLER